MTIIKIMHDMHSENDHDADNFLNKFIIYVFINKPVNNENYRY